MLSGVKPGGSCPRRPGWRGGEPAGQDEAEGTKVGRTVALGAEQKAEWSKMQFIYSFNYKSYILCFQLGAQYSYNSECVLNTIAKGDNHL